MANVYVTVNGVPVERVIDQEIREEIQTHHQSEVKTLGFVKIVHIKSSAKKNYSGARSGRGRVIFHRGGAL